MAGPEEAQRSASMLVEVANTTPMPSVPLGAFTISNSREECAPQTSRESVLRRLSEALLRRSLAKIDLSQRGLQATDARLVKLALSQNANLTVLKLGYNNLGDFGVATLATGIAAHKSLVLLDLGFNNFGDEGAKALSVALRHVAKTCSGGTLRTLYLAGNLIGEDGALAIADFIRQGSRLRKLYMTGNRIGPEGVGAIAEAILEDELRQRGEQQPEDDVLDFPSSSDSKGVSPVSSFEGMQELFLGGTGLNTLGFRSVARLLEWTYSLRVISLPNCTIGDEEMYLLASSVGKNKSRLPLESIQLSFNNITHRGIESLRHAIWGSTTLKELKIDNNQIGDRGAHHVAALLPALKRIEVLDVGFNSIGDNGLKVLMNAVADAEQITSLSVSGNSLDTGSAQAVGSALAVNRSLRSIYLVCCNVEHEGQRRISAGAVSNKFGSLRTLTGFDLGPCVVSLGFPEAMANWTNEQVMNFVRLMYDQQDGIEGKSCEAEFDEFSSSIDSEGSHRIPLEPSVVVGIANATYESLVANGVDVTRQRQRLLEPSFGSPLAGDAIITESSSDVTTPSKPSGGHEKSGRLDLDKDFQVSLHQSRSFVVPPESSNKEDNAHNDLPDPARKQRIVEWLCANSQHLNDLAQMPFNSRELWRLHQHYFTPVVNESGGSILQPAGDMIISSVPDVPGGRHGLGDPVTAHLSGLHQSVPVSDPAIQVSPPNSLPMLKRKVSYRFLSDTISTPPGRVEFKTDFSVGSAAVARLIEDGPTGHSLPPKTKKARRNRTRISFVPRIKAKLDACLDMCHEKALSTMRQLHFVEQAILGGQIHELEPSSTPRTHLSGVLAAEAEMIIVDMI